MSNPSGGTKGGPAAPGRGRGPLGLVVNPVAGMGGRVGLKGTDGPEVLAEARRRGAVPLAPDRVGLFLARLGPAAREVRWLTVSGAMGADLLVAAGLAEGRDFEVVHTAGAETTAGDTHSACSAAVARGAGAIVFCGGDGTARDVLAAVGDRCPVLGVPVGVKMFSGVFALSPKAAADVLRLYLEGRAEEGEGEVADVDEVAYREGKLRVRLHGMLRILRAPMLIQSMKSASIVPEEGDYQAAIAKYVFELVYEEEGTLAILGAGTTLEAVAEALGVPKTPLGVDVYLMGRMVVADASEADLLAALGRHKGRALIVVSPIGAQGFVLGRGTQQISPAVVAAAGGPDSVLVVGTPHKLAGIAALRVDTGDAGLDDMLSGWRRIIVGYHEMRMMRIEPAAGPSP